MKKNPLSLAFAAALTAVTMSSAVLAEDTLTPVAGVADVSQLQGKVVVINRDTRIMTLETADGVFEVVHIPAQVQRIDEIDVGDTVSIEETQAVLVDIEKGKDAGSMGSISESAIERDPGAKPSGTMVDKVTLYGKVVGVDRANSAVTVRGPKQTVTLKVEDPAILKDLAPGDGVVATYVRVITGKVSF